MQLFIELWKSMKNRFDTHGTVYEAHSVSLPLNIWIRDLSLSLADTQTTNIHCTELRVNAVLQLDMQSRTGLVYFCCTKIYYNWISLRENIDTSGLKIVQVQILGFIY